MTKALFHSFRKVAVCIERVKRKVNCSLNAQKLFFNNLELSDVMPEDLDAFIILISSSTSKLVSGSYVKLMSW